MFNKTRYFVASFFSLPFLLASHAFAASTGGSGLPYESWLNTLVNSVTGPMATAIAIIALVGCFSALIFGGEISGVLKSLIYFVIAVAGIIAAKPLLTGLTGQGAEITAPHVYVMPTQHNTTDKVR